MRVQALDYLLLFALLQVVNRSDCCPRITVTPKDKILKAQLSVSATVYILIMRTQVSWRAYTRFDTGWRPMWWPAGCQKSAIHEQSPLRGLGTGPWSQICYLWALKSAIFWTEMIRAASPR
ncbi:hypothetical protein BD769DRAFT_397358 [Suillus cothurnatus]|nr:hypothetical protein BD769DRAFT_397358 [Suillus cothurnatus]